MRLKSEHVVGMVVFCAIASLFYTIIWYNYQYPCVKVPTQQHTTCHTSSDPRGGKHLELHHDHDRAEGLRGAQEAQGGRVT